MAINLPTSMYECRYASVGTLDDIVLRLSLGRPDKKNNLKIVTSQISIDQVPWHTIQHMRIIGQENAACNKALLEMNFTQGAYINQHGNWLMLITANGDRIQEYLNACGAGLKTFSANNSNPKSLSFDLNIELEQLVLINNSSLEEITSLGNLTHLNYFRCTSCSSIKSLPGLGKLKQLNYLNLFKCSNLISLAGLEKLTQLTYLNLSGCEKLLSLPKFDTHSQLANLYLSGCHQLAEVDLTGCNELIILQGLETLRELEYIDFSGCDKLHSISLQGCECLTSIFGLETLTDLTELNLSSCRSLRELPEGIRNAKKLRWLNLQFLHLTELPNWILEIAEHISMDKSAYKTGDQKAVVYMYGTTIDGIDMAIFDEPHTSIIEWFEAREREQFVPLNEIKVVFLGDGEAGKSYTIARLMNDGGTPVDYADHATPGIAIKHKDYDLDGRKIQVHYWDFGGQEIMHSMHRIFLTGRTLYVILLNARDDTQTRAEYWLQNVKSFAPEAPILLVLNKIDQNPNASVDERTLRDKYEQLAQVSKISALNFNKDKFNQYFTSILLEEIQNSGYLDEEWPISWIRVKSVLEQMKTHYIHGNEYEKICQKYGVETDKSDLLKRFNNLGVSFCWCDDEDYELVDHVILRPDWITNALYIILFNEHEGAKDGMIPLKSIHNMLRNAHRNPSIRCTMPQANYSQPGDIQYVLGVMRKFQLSFQNGDEYEFIPMLCQRDSKVRIRYYQEDSEILEFNMCFDYLPNNLLHQLMVQRHSELDMDQVWRTGARFHLPDLGLSAILAMGEKVLQIFIRHTNAMYRPNIYLAMLKTNVDRIWMKMGLNKPTCYLIYKKDGARDAFDYDELKELQEEGEVTIRSKALRGRIRISEIMHQSAPDEPSELDKLLDSFITACLSLQGNKNYRGWNENGRNCVIRDSLSHQEYIVRDQTLDGISESGKSFGELDLVIYRTLNRPWALCEALVVTGYTKEWNKHLDKLLCNYNPHGLSTLLLLTYVDCKQEKFGEIWEIYQEFIQQYDPKDFRYDPDSFMLNPRSSYPFIKIVQCQYKSALYAPTVYHIFVQMDPK